MSTYPFFSRTFGTAPKLIRGAVAFLVLTWLFSARAVELPSGGQIVSGSGSINQSGNQLTITQASDRLVAQWGTFNIGENATVQFNQPDANAVALNRIFDQNPSQILGSLKANGQVFLVNPSGIYFGKNSTVNVGSLVASSLDISNEDFLGGKYRFINTGGAGSVTNLGKISANSGGVVALISPVVSNEGKISARRGAVALGAGNKVSLDFNGDGLIRFTIDEAAVEAQVSNKGLIKSDAGVVFMTARAAGNFSSSVVSNSGVIEARTMHSRNGRIILDGGDAGSVQSTGKLDATGRKVGETGGKIIMTGEKVGLFGSAVVDASGKAGGGQIYIGGGYQGKDPAISNAKKTYIGAEALMKANAGALGQGGQIVVWSDEGTQFYGKVEARGGRRFGDGGKIEVSGKNNLIFKGLVDASAAKGRAGTLLLDPKDIIVTTGGGAVLSSDALAFTTNFSGSSTIDPSTITAVTDLGTAVTLQANNDIVVSNSITSNNLSGVGGTLIFQAGLSITVNADIFSDNGDVSFKVNDEAVGVAGQSAYRSSGVASLSNNNHINAGTGSVSISMGTQSTSGAISTGQITANNFTITHNGTTPGAVTGKIDLGQSAITNDLNIITTSARNVVNTAGTVTVGNSANINTTGGDVTLTTPTTNINMLRVNAANVTINNTNAIQVGTTVATGNLTIRASGDLTLVPGATLTATAGDIALSTEGVGNFINNAGAGALSVGGGHRWLIYSKTPDLVGSVHTVKGGLTSSFRQYGKTYSSDAPVAITATGNGFIYADFPANTLTVTPAFTGTASHIYGDAPIATPSYVVSSGFVDAEDNSSNIGLTGTALYDRALSSTMSAGAYAIHYTGGLSSRYPLVADVNSVSYSVTARPITLKADDQSRIFGNANPTTGTYTITSGNLVNSNTLASTVAVGSPALITSSVGGYALTPSSASFTAGTASDYAITYSAGSLAVTPRSIIITAINQSRAYGDPNPTLGPFTVGGGGLVGSDMFNSNLSVTSPATSASHVGNFTLTPSNAAFSVGFASNYSITYAVGTLAVAARPITLTPVNQNRFYGNANPATGSFTIGGSGFANTDVLAATLAVTSPATVTSHVGSFTLTPSGAVFTTGTASDYAITYAAGTLGVAARPITVTAANQSRVYGNANPATGGFIVGGSNLVNGDTLATTIALSSSADLTSSIGSYTLTGQNIGFTSGASGDYAITYPSGSLGVTARPITLTANNQSRVYGDGNPSSGAFTLSGNGLVNGDTVSPIVSVSSPAIASSHVGSYELNPVNAIFSGVSGGNYNVTYYSGLLAVTQRPITLTANNLSRFYGDANPLAGAFTIGGSGLSTTDALAATLAVASPATVASHIGNYTLTPSSVVFTTGVASDYTITYLNGILGVLARPITVMASSQSRTYGDANPTSGGIIFSNGTLTNNDALAAAVVVTSPAVATSPVGNYALTLGAVSFTAGTPSDYAITYASGALAVIPAVLTYNATAASRVYGDVNPLFSGSVTGFKNGETLLSATTGAALFTSSTNVVTGVGPYAMTGAGLVANYGNYTFVQAPGNATAFTIAPRPVAVSPVGYIRLYGDSNPATIAVVPIGLVNGDSLSSATFATVATPMSSVGTYASTPSNAVFSTGFANNYAISYIDGVLSISPRPLTVTPNNQTRIYGEANPVVGFATGNNLVNGDRLGSLTLSSPATPKGNIGVYTLFASSATFTQGSLANYSITYAPGALAVTPRPLTLVADAQSKIHGMADPSFTYKIETPSTGRGLLADDVLLGALSRAVGEAVADGPYAISPGTLGANSNYIVNYMGNKLTVQPATLTYVAAPFSLMAGSSMPELGGAITGFVTGENLLNATAGSVSWSTLAGVYSRPGSYAITGSGLTALSDNYVFIQSDLNETALRITMPPSTEIYNPVVPVIVIPEVIRRDKKSLGSNPDTLGYNPETGAFTDSSLAGRGGSFNAPIGFSTGYVASGVIGSLSAPGGAYNFVTLPDRADTMTGYGLQLRPSRPVSVASTISAPAVLLPDVLTPIPAFTPASASVGTPSVFTLEGGSMSLSLGGTASVQYPSRASDEGTPVSLYLESNGGPVLVGSFSVSRGNRVITLAPAQDQQAVKLAAGPEGHASKYLFRDPAGQAVQLVLSLSPEGVLTINAPISFLKLRGVKGVALAGLAAAGDELTALLKKARSIKVVAK